MLFNWIFHGNVGVSILGVSVTVSLLCLPLYAKAERLQEKERDIEKKLSKRVASIKSHFHGDEQYMILSTYYRQNHYHPLYSLRSSVSLLIQVPFFIAAYSFLSHLDALKGLQFLFIRDLGAPDGLLRIGSLSVNVLPVIMTAINIISGAIYTKGFPLKDKVQLYLMALVFLVLLYASPSALVIYWTLNNVFSLVKNIVFKMKNPLRFLYLAMCAAVAAACFYTVFVRHHSTSFRLRNISLSIAASALLVCTPLYIRFARFLGRTLFKNLFTDARKTFALFFVSAASLWLLFGVFIPFNLVASSPFEFSYIGKNPSPFSLLFYPAAQCAGIFLLWPLYIYVLFPKRVKAILAVSFAALLIAAVASVFVFPGDFGTVSRTLQFNNGGLFKVGKNLLVGIALFTATAFALFCVLVAKKRTGIATTAFALVAVSLFGITAYKGSLIADGFRRYGKIQAEESANASKHAFSLSKTEKNVFIIMLDKAISSYFPLAVSQRPDLAKSYSGFTYYPNTVSYADKTILGAPPLFGGYEYTPKAMNARNTVRMQDKHNESLLMMPMLFKEHGFQPTFTNAPFVNYDWVADSAFFKSRGINASNLTGSLTERYQREHLSGIESYSAAKLLERNLTLFSLMAALPGPLKDVVYDDGRYWNSSLLSVNTLTLDSYAALRYLADVTGLDAKTGTLSIMDSDLAHEPCRLQYPDYTFVERVTDSGPNMTGNADDEAIYEVNAASFILIGQWLDWLRANGVYDNTRVIIVSDHGNEVNNKNLNEFQVHHVTRYNPILLVKDFNAKGDLATDGTFMTNADVPLLAAKGLIDDPVNPLTGNKLMPEKDRGVDIVLDTTLHQGYQPDLHTTKTCYRSGAGAWHVEKDIFREENWTEVKMDK
jgi:YidC/Oxa1 family membrane protein insertase